MQYNEAYYSILQSTKNLCIFKLNGVKDRARQDYLAIPKLSDGKKILNQKCKDSILYQCYSDSNKYMLCDFTQLDMQPYI